MGNMQLTIMRGVVSEKLVSIKIKTHKLNTLHVHGTT